MSVCIFLHRHVRRGTPGLDAKTKGNITQLENVK